MRDGANRALLRQNIQHQRRPGVEVCPDLPFALPEAIVRRAHFHGDSLLILAACIAPFLPYLAIGVMLVPIVYTVWTTSSRILVNE